jgi:hypothetical protein
MSWSEVSVAGGAAQAEETQPRRIATAGINLMIGGVQRSKLFPAFRLPRVLSAGLARRITLASRILLFLPTKRVASAEARGGNLSAVFA